MYLSASVIIVDESVKQIADAIMRRANPEGVTIIGIEGYGGSGKSTLATNLREILGNAYVINFDDFIIKNKISDADKSGFDKQRLEQQVLIPAKEGKFITYQKLEWVENKLSEPIRVPGCKYLIVEGISCYHPSVAKYYDYKIWVEVSVEIAKQRGSKRDKDLGNDNDKLWEIWAKTDIEYQSKYHPEQQADFTFYNR